MIFSRAANRTAILLLAVCVTAGVSAVDAQTPKKTGTGSTRSTTKTVKTGPVKMTGLRPITGTTSPLVMTGAQFTQKSIVTSSMRMTGAGFIQKQVKSDPLTMTGIR